jgi:hypothetical protein
MRSPAAHRPAAGVPAPYDDTVERAFAAAAADPARLDDLLTVLRQGRLWLPLPSDGAPAVAGGAIRLPVLRYLGEDLVPAYTCAARLLAGEPAADGPAVPYAVVRAADLAQRLPPGTGIALNPGGRASVPISSVGVAQLAAEHAMVGGGPVSVGPAVVPLGLLAAVAARLRRVPAAREATAAWLTVGTPGTGGSGLVLAIGLDDPGDSAARYAALAAVRRGVADAPGGPGGWDGWDGPVDVTFPGEGEPDVIDRWVTTAGTAFWRRSVAAARLPAPRRPVS